MKVDLEAIGKKDYERWQKALPKIRASRLGGFEDTDARAFLLLVSSGGLGGKKYKEVVRTVWDRLITTVEIHAGDGFGRLKPLEVRNLDTEFIYKLAGGGVEGYEPSRVLRKALGHLQKTEYPIDAGMLATSLEQDLHTLCAGPSIRDVIFADGLKGKKTTRLARIAVLEALRLTMIKKLEKS